MSDAHFVMKGYSPDLVNTYDCSRCKAAGLPHEVVTIPGPPTDRRSCWPMGIPTTIRKCTGCGHTDGPWVSAEIVGGGW